MCAASAPIGIVVIPPTSIPVPRSAEERCAALGAAGVSTTTSRASVVGSAASVAAAHLRYESVSATATTRNAGAALRP